MSKQRSEQLVTNWANEHGCSPRRLWVEYFVEYCDEEQLADVGYIEEILGSFEDEDAEQYK